MSKRNNTARMKSARTSMMATRKLKQFNAATDQMSNNPYNVDLSGATMPRAAKQRTRMY